jgi:hypothetical protein
MTARFQKMITRFQNLTAGFCLMSRSQDKPIKQRKNRKKPQNTFEKLKKKTSQNSKKTSQKPCCHKDHKNYTCAFMIGQKIVD